MKKLLRVEGFFSSWPLGEKVMKVMPISNKSSLKFFFFPLFFFSKKEKKN